MFQRDTEESLFVAKPVQLSTLLTGIQQHDVALPNFQRPWVWNPNMVRELIISVAYRYPAGSLLTMPIKANQFGLRPFEGAGEKLNKDPNLMILDGQQRLTSLYQSLYYSEGVQFKGRIYHFYLDVDKLLSDKDGLDEGEPLFEEALFFVMLEKDGKKIRYKDLRPQYEITNRDMEITNGALPLWLTFDSSDKLANWKNDYFISKCEKDMDEFIRQGKEWDKLVKPWLDRIRLYPFPVVDLKPDLPLSAICHIFEKVNSTGVPLDVFDLCNAILWSQGFFLNQKWEETKKILKDKNILRMQSPSGTYFLMSLALLDSLDQKLAHPDQEVFINCRKQDLMKLSKQTMEKWWDSLVEGYFEASKFMNNQGVIAERILPYSTLIIPLAAIFAYLKKTKTQVVIENAWPKLERWYWCSIFGQRYSSQVEYSSAQDVEHVIGWINGGEEPTAVKTFNFRSDALQEITSIRNVIYRGVLCLLCKNHAKDFGGGGELSIDMMYETRQDHHHIFPTDAASKLSIKDNRINTIINKTLISATVNRSIGGKPPSQYLTILQAKIPETKMEEILKSHEINPELLKEDRWQEYITDRRERIRKMIETMCGGVVQPFADEDLTIEEDDDEE